MSHRICSHLLCARVTVLWILFSCSTRAINRQCSMQCTTATAHAGELYSKCNVSDTTMQNCSFEAACFLQLRNISFLDLSGNRFREIPTELLGHSKSLKILNIGLNRLTNIEAGTFENLTNLRTLNLPFNNLQDWKVDHQTELWSLRRIDVSGNKAWFPRKQLLQLKNLTAVQGVTWTKYCGECLLTRVGVNGSGSNTRCSSRYDELSSPKKWLWNREIRYGRALELIKAGFWPTCLCDDGCYLHQFRLPNRKAFYHISNKGGLLLYFFGSLGVVTNITVILAILFSNGLRRDTAAILICNVAVCDALISSFSITYAMFHNSKPLTEELMATFEGRNDSCDYRCKLQYIRNFAGPVFMTATISQVWGSFVMVLEKFLKIVYPMKPNIWIERRGTLAFLLVSWPVAICVSVLPVFGVSGLAYRDYVPSDPRGIVFFAFLALSLIQCTSLLLYIPMVIVPKRIAVDAGVKRETNIAKKLALLVFTNLVFFTCPVVLGVVWSVARDRLPTLPLKETQWLVFAFAAFPFLCLSINSALNPFLYALRYPRIKRRLKELRARFRTFAFSVPSFFTQFHCCNTNVVHVEHNVELEHR